MKTLQINATFEGNNYTISNLSISTSANYVGLFAATGGNAEIDNVGLLNVKIQGQMYVGGLVGHNLGKINDSFVVGEVKGEVNTGGLVGKNGEHDPDEEYLQTKISNSHAIIIVGNTSSTQVGGLVGRNEAEIKNSYVIAKQISGQSEVGGLVGHNYEGSITDSYATVKELTGCRLVGNINNDNNTSNKMIGNCNHSTLFEQQIRP